jgi:tetratricopeptide (TPR) repeat protein
VSRRRLTLAVLAVVCAIYGVRAAGGVVTGIAFARARLLATEGPSWRALDLLEVSDLGVNRFAALREAGEERVSLWDRQVDNDGILGADPQILALATADYVQALCMSPASSRPWEGLGEVYDRRERIRRVVEMGIEDEPEPGLPRRWSDVGHPGRVAIGMLRRATESAPAWYVSYDELAMMLWRYGLDADTRRAAARSAQVLPLYARHRYPREDEVPGAILDAFAAESWKLEGRVRFLSSRDHMIDLAKLELERGQATPAVEALRRALAQPGDALNEAEASYHLGVALMSLERWDEAVASFRLSETHPSFRAVSLLSLARIAERTGDLELALRMLRDLRWEQPDEVAHCIEYARVARRLKLWAESLEALRWALVVEPGDSSVTAELVQTYLEMGDVALATSTLRALEETDEDLDVEHLRRAVTAAAASGAPPEL